MDRARLIQILRCPETMQLVFEASSSELTEINRRIAAGEVRKHSGQMQIAPLTTGLFREDRQLLFPIIDDIPVMLLEEALVLP